jgi:hypothetical protein
MTKRMTWTRSTNVPTKRYVSDDGHYIILQRVNGWPEQNGWIAGYKANPAQAGAQRLAFHLKTFDEAERVVAAHRAR